MLRYTRTVPSRTWQLSDALSARRDRLLDAITPAELLDRVAIEAMEAAHQLSIPLCWQESTDKGSAGYFRVRAQVPFSETTFDQFFNGSAGYRAQYYLSPEEGILFNRDALEALLPAMRKAYEMRSIAPNLDQILRSLLAPHAKIWVFNELQAFDQAARDSLNPSRWVKNNATRGRRAPLPGHLMLDVKGAFIKFSLDDLYVFELKLDRANDIFLRGYS